MRDPWQEAMLDGAFERAWDICDDVLRQRTGASCAHLPYHLRWVWDGTPFAGRRVLVRCYHGLGDTLQFIRFVPRIAAIARQVIIEAQPELLPLIRSVHPNGQWFGLGAELPAHDVAIESMEVPHALRLTLGDLPGPVPYLLGEGVFARRSSLFRREQKRPIVGLTWSGGGWRRERSIPPQLLLPLLGLPADFIGLQLGPARHAPEAVPLVAGLADLIPADISITGTAALMQELDLIITIDSMVAHLAGALGRPVWTLLDAEADWRWMRYRPDTPWYPTMRLFRQPQPGAWRTIIDDVARSLELRLGRAPGTRFGGVSLREEPISSHQPGV